MSKRAGTWEIEGRYLVTNAEVAQIRYIRRVTDCNQFDSLFIEALAVKLASKIALPINGSGAISQGFLTEYEKLTGGRARRTDAFESHSDRQPAWMNSDLVWSRFIRGA